MEWRKLTYRLGLVGPILIIAGSLLTALAYTGVLGQRYSFLNHFISELGEVGVSEWAAIFNISLFVGGLCVTGFMLGAARLFGNWFGILFGLVGLATGISGSLVGIFPMPQEAHGPVAMWFFRTALASSAMYAIYVVASRQDRFARWTSIPAASISIITFAFLFLVPFGDSDGGDLMLTSARPMVWASATLEWGVFVAVMAWVLATSLDLRAREV
jgi:hypothetical membrane protein